ncbi:hypothetical protein BkAM31D_03895 [Halalkalibacter krulwichiae]|uniref:Uncharacterized protein n=2 Tax=Halalkalibacter krulwichiae TaxID=199441 RepID=A0A1X9M6K6_9BACI|nr:hypothetical protein BkAM31D_03895 [Halalkalibacter krulwichiae]
MKEGKLKYKFVGEYVSEKDARRAEAKLIRKYKQLGQAKFNKHTQ